MAAQVQDFVKDLSTSLDELIAKLRESTSLAEGELKKITAEAEKLKKTLGDGLGGDTVSAARRIDELSQAYKKLGVDVSEYREALAAVESAEKDRKKVLDLVNSVDVERSDTYNAMSAQYRALKILINELTEAERAEGTEGAKIVARSKELYAEMNKLQQATGKYTLQVGNYTKAFNGMNIATQQVIRELPVLANGWNTFFIAISNNVPILVDQIALFRAEQAALAKQGLATTSVLKALLSSLFSWNTMLVLILTALPIVTKRLQEKKKATEELNGKTKEQVTYLGLLKNALLEAEKQEVSDIAKLKTLVAITEDVNRSKKEQIQAAQELKGVYKEQLANYSAEDIALGRARSAIDSITQSLKQQAQARAYLTKITDAYVKQIDAEQVISSKGGERTGLGYAPTIASLARYVDNLKKQLTDGGFKRAMSNLTISKETRKSLEEYQAAFQEFGEYGKLIDELTKKIPVGGLITKAVTGGDTPSAVEATLEEVNDYFYEYLESEYNLIRDAREREIKLTELSYNKQIEEVANRVQEESTQSKQLANLVEARGRAIQAINEKYDEEERKRRINARIEELKLQNDTSSATIVAENKNSITRRKLLLENEVSYWEEYRDILASEGALTAEEMKNIQAQIDAATNEASKTHPRNLWELFGVAIDEDFTKQQLSQLESVFNTAISYASQWVSAVQEMADANAQAYEDEVSAAKSALEYEMELRAQGYANSVESARALYQEKLRLQEEALEESEKLQKVQEAIDTATQVSSLVTATASTLAAFPGPLLPLAIAAIATMWATFIGAKATAWSLAGTTTYGEGMSEYLDYGGSHASGNDIDFGTTKDGTRRRVERGEMIGVINKRNVNKYGVKQVGDIIDALNQGKFEEKYGLAFSGIDLLATSRPTDVSRLESDVRAIREQGDTSRYLDASGNMVIRYKNLTKRIKS